MARYRSNLPILLHINQPAVQRTLEKETWNLFISREQCVGVIYGTPGTAYIPPLQSCGIAECFPSTFERPSIPVVR